MSDQIDEIGKTAFIAACWRDEEKHSQNPIFEDSYAKYFINDESRQIAKQLADILPEMKEGISLRVKYFDDMLSKQIGLGKKQIIVLGAGLDSRAIRQGRSDAVFFEIDKPEFFLLKKDVFSKNSIVCDATYVPCDYLNEDFISLLIKNNFNVSLPTYIIWEGNVAYLAKDEALKTLKKIQSSIDNFVISFDYISDKIVSRSSGFQSEAAVLNAFESLGVPWRTGFRSIEEVESSLKLKTTQ